MAFAMLRPAWAMDRPTKADCIDVKLILKCVRWTSKWGFYGVLAAFSDAVFAEQDGQRAAQ